MTGDSVTMQERSGECGEKARLEAFDWMMRLDAAPDHPATKAAFRAWLDESDEHATLYAQTRRVWEAAPHLSPSFNSQWRRHTQVVPLPVRGLIGRRQWLIGAAAATAVAFAAGPLADLWADHHTDTGETKHVALADGSVMQLDTDSAVRVALGPARRDITLLRGRAFFEVARDPARPFAVVADNVEARALGTRFEVRREEHQIMVAVAEGVVAVSRQSRDLYGAALKAGEAVTVQVSTGDAQRTAIAPDAIGSWREQRLVVDSWSVAAVLEELGRYHHGVIVLRDDALGARLVSGTYDLGRPIDAVHAVAQSQGGTVTAISPRLLVVSARP